jgi:hypothetical protein
MESHQMVERITTWTTMLMPDNAKFGKPFVANTDRTTFRWNSTVIGEWGGLSIHASPQQWEKLAAYCLECAAAEREVSE